MLQLDRWIIAASLCLLICGCGGGNGLATAPTTGEVTYQGKPLPYGSVSFRPKAGSPATGDIQADGTFTLTTYSDGDGAIVGMHEVLISATEAHARTAQPVEAGMEAPVPKSLIPQKYTSFSTSGITAEVKPGEKNHVVIELKD
ncbi:hypothetical protein [Blastopirellula marina]|uniref:Carboxypeptidase regulatory-like domain-containing protein n=1 Tax=Blastopirellula marina TaxID=124 RepID=A0A2S8FW96_9BACT|nr:hypothetical protein [Blastopirellula marina]PQO36449.1 hypothetical protein C5Y98_12155 [Blastopirellula marina]PQO47331.1 hypothetical protein C5Y93_04630 [Blastopirellula marina]PTL44286.1 hypothetical protein C5Y97_12165 [Blastopirellula marina]